MIAYSTTPKLRISPYNELQIPVHVRSTSVQKTTRKHVWMCLIYMLHACTTRGGGRHCIWTIQAHISTLSVYPPTTTEKPDIMEDYFCCSYVVFN